jgi:hypothetical protein
MHIFRTLSRTLALAVSSVALFAPGASSALTITVNSSSGSCSSQVDVNGNVAINCAGGGGGGPTCSVTGTTNVTSAGGPVSYTATNCGTSGTWSSTRPGFPGCGTGTTCSDTLPANTTTNSASYTYTFSGTGSGSQTVTESGQSAGGGGGGGGDTISCSNIPGVKSTKVVNMPWQFTSSIISTSKQGGFGAGDAFVFVIVPPLGSTSSGKLGSFSTAPTDANSYNPRIIALSDQPCDFSRKLGKGSVVQGMTLTAYFSVGGFPIDKYGRQDTTYPSLIPGHQYFVTVIQEDSVGGNNTCFGSSCNMNYGLSPGT